MTKQASKAPDYQVVLDKVVSAKGDLAKLTDDERAAYYTHVCESVGLNPLTQPLGYLMLSGRLTLYAYKAACDQLREIHQVSIYRLDKEQIGDLMEVTVYARNGSGREDVDMGAVSLSGLKGDALVNAKLKAITKAKRRVTLSICGLGWMDETEIETIPGALPVAVDQAGHVSETPAKTEPAPEPPKQDAAAASRSEAKALLDELAGNGVEAYPARVALIEEFGGSGAKLSGFDADRCAAFVEFLQAKKAAGEDPDPFEETPGESATEETAAKTRRGQKAGAGS